MCSGLNILPGQYCQPDADSKSAKAKELKQQLTIPVVARLETIIVDVCRCIGTRYNPDRRFTVCHRLFLLAEHVLSVQGRIFYPLDLKILL